MMGEQGGQESIFTLEAARLKFGGGAVEELGWDLARLGLARVFVVADPRLRTSGVLDRIGNILAASVVAFDATISTKTNVIEAASLIAASVAGERAACPLGLR